MKVQKILLPIIAVLGAAVFFSVFIVKEVNQAIVLQFGDPKRIIVEPGLNFKIPFIQNVVYLDKRILNLDTPPAEVIASDQKRLIVDAFARFKIMDPLKFYISVGNERVARSRLATIINSRIRSVLGTQRLQTLLSEDRNKQMNLIQEGVNAEAEKFGIKIVDVSNGIGPLGTSIALKSELEYTKRELAQLVTVPVSENQLLGLTSFATHIGLGNFAKSELLVELNDGNYADVPMYMKRWRVGKVGAESDPQVRQDYIQRREYEIELFTTPDWLKLSHTEMGLDGNKNLSFRQLRSQLVSAKQSKYVEMGFINLIED